jgi:P27 family predicted phage terminase small subunit
MAKGAKHLTKEEIRERMASEVQPRTEGIAAPSYLTAKQKKQFTTIAEQLDRLGIMGETDCDTLARYITAQGFYEDAVKELRRLQKERPKSPEDDADVEAVEAFRSSLSTWLALVDIVDKRQDRYFKQAMAAASKLGLTITDRCKLVVPQSAEPPKGNKFARFGAGKAAENE